MAKTSFKNIFDAIEKGTIENVQYLVDEKGVDVNKKDGMKFTPLHRAAQEGSIEVTKYLVSKGADIHAKSWNGTTPIHSPANVEIAEFLISQGADVNSRGSSGWTPLHYEAYWKSNTDVANFLISQGADVDAQDDNGETPLHQAAIAGKIGFVRFLVSKGANVHAKDKKGKTPIDFARKGRKKVIVEFLSGGKDDPRWIDISDKYAFVSKKVLKKNGVVKYMYREEPDNEDDSGWNLFDGTENDDYVNNPENIKMVSIDDLLGMDSSLLEPLKDEPVVAYERENNNAEWKKIKNWTPPKE